MIPFTNEHGYHDYRGHVDRGGSRVRLRLLLACAIALVLMACHRSLVVYVVPLPLVHNIGAWLDADQVCVPPPLEALYISRRCLSMAAIRSLILDARSADDEGSK